MTKICHIDEETTGKDWRLNSIHQLAGIIQINSSIEERFDIRLRPILGSIIDPKSLAVSGVTEKEIMAYPPFTDGLKRFVHILAKYADMTDPKDKFFLSGYGVSFFDGPFLNQLFLKAGSPTFTNWFYSATLDSATLAAYVLRNERANMPDFKLPTVAKRMGIEPEPEKLHNATYDVQLHYDVDERLRRVLPS